VNNEVLPSSALTMLLSIAQWIQLTAPFTYLRESHYTYPVVLSLHMVALAFFGGMILMTDLRLLGWAMRSRSVSDVVDQLRVPKRIGFLLMVTFGFLLFGCKAEEYYYNPFFRIKVILLTCVAIHALIFRGSVYNFADKLDRAGLIPGRAKVAAALSLLLWTGIACMGRGIGYIDPPFGLHARLWPF
jgi:hypothetical protein